MRGQEAMLIPVKFGSMRREVGHLLHPLTRDLERRLLQTVSDN